MGGFIGGGGKTSSRVKVIAANRRNIRGSSQQNFTGSEMVLSKDAECDERERTFGNTEGVKGDTETISSAAFTKKAVSSR